MVFFFKDTATTEIYTLSLHDALPILDVRVPVRIVVGTGHAQPIARGEVQALLARIVRVPEPTLDEQDVGRLGVVVVRAAVVGFVAVVVAGRFDARRPVEVVDHEQVELAIGVGIHERRARPPATVADLEARSQEIGRASCRDRV